MANPSILVIDDEAFMRRVVRQTLSCLGFDRVVDVSSAIEALALLGKSSFDLVLSDVYMPNLSGLGLLKQIRAGQTQAPRDSRFIALTSFSNIEVLSTAMQLDVNGFMAKPIKSDTVKRNIHQALHETMCLRSETEYEMIPIAPHLASHKERTIIAVGSGHHPAKSQVESSSRKAEAEHQKVEAPRKVEVEPRNEILADDEDEPGGARVSVLQIPLGAVLAERLVAKDGTLLLSAGQTLNQQVINRLQELYPILRSDMLKVVMPEKNSELGS